MPGGRPRKKIDKEQLKKLAMKFWPIESIADFFGVSRDTIKRRFAETIDEGRAAGKAKLVDYQWKRLLDNSDRILIHMSKHYLGQHEKSIVEATGDKATYVVIDKMKDGEVIGETILQKTEEPE